MTHIDLSVHEVQENLNPFAISQAQLDEAAEVLGLDPDMHAFLRQPMRELHFTIPVRMDNGRTKTFPAFRVQYNDARGPAKGGLRFHPDETIDTVRALAAWMTWKTAVADIPLGGGKGGVICNPRQMSQGELERVSRGYMRGIAHFVSIHRDVPAPDVNTNPKIMAWMLDEYERIHGRHEPGVITGKPPELGGSAGRGPATALGSIVAIREATHALGLHTHGSTCAIQGYGNVGSAAHKLGSEILGLEVVAISDEFGALYNEKGLDYEQVSAYVRRHGRLEGFPEAEEISNSELLELDVDVLTPAAIENQITRRNAHKIKAKIVAELANGPTTPEANDILVENGTFIIPDFLCNAGGVIVSYFEMVQNSSNFYWNESEVNRQLDQKMTRAFLAVHQMAEEAGVDHRVAAYLVAVNRVAQAVRLRGWV